LRSDLYASIWDVFKAHGIRMPPPKYGDRRPDGASASPETHAPGRSPEI